MDFFCYQVKESFKLGKEENAESASSSGTGASKEENHQQQQQSGNTEGGQQPTLFGKIKSSISSPLDLAKKGLDIVKDELRGGTPKKKHLEYTPPPPFTGVRSTRTDLVVTPTKQSKWQKKWESLREKVTATTLFSLFRLFHVFIFHSSCLLFYFGLDASSSCF